MNKRKALTMLMTLPLLLVGCSTNGGGSNYIDNENEQGLDFYLLDDGTYGVGVGTAYYLTNIVVPSTYRGKEVTKVVKHGFGQYSLDETPKLMFKNITLPNTIQTIDEYAFYGSYLETINIPKSVISMGESALNCEELKEITYDGTLEEFNNIELGERLLYSYGISSGEQSHNYFNGANINFKFSDKEVKMFDLFDKVELQRQTGYKNISNYGYSPVYTDVEKNEEIKISKLNKEGIVFYFRLKTDYFGGFYRSIEDLEVTLDNDVATASVSTSTFDGNSFTITPKSVGTTNVNIKSGDKTFFTFKLAVIDSIEVSLHEAVQIYNELEEDTYTEYWYSVTAYIYEKLSSNRISIVAEMPEEGTPWESLELMWTDRIINASAIQSVTSGTRVKVEGRLYKSTTNYPEFAYDSTVTILE